MSEGDDGWIVFAVRDDIVRSFQVANENVPPAGTGSVQTMPSEHCPA